MFRDGIFEDGGHVELDMLDFDSRDPTVDELLATQGRNGVCQKFPGRQILHRLRSLQD